jgi:hypothetical protein
MCIEDMRLLHVLLSLRPRPLAGALVVGALVAGAGSLSAQRPTPPTASASPAVRWPVRTLPALDLWLHAFALLSNDSAQAPTVPLYARGYRDSILAVKHRGNVLTSLDANQSVLVEGLAKRGGYLDAQFIPFEFATWADFQRAGDLFIQVQGDPRRAGSREAQLSLVPFASVFSTASDREWLRLFLAGVADEQARFYDAELSRVARERRDVITAVDSLWQHVYRAKFDRFLSNSGQRQGELVLTLPVGGEGRTSTTRAQRTMVAVPFPARAAEARQALYVLAHELTGTLVGPVITDNVTPAEQRAGTASRYVSMGQVISGALLLARVAPDLREGYQRYYLTQVGVKIPAGADIAALFDSTFPLPQAIRDALGKQLDLVLGGI